MTLRSETTGQLIPLTVTRSAAGVRSVTAPHGVDGPALLKQLDREFVLLDGVTFQTFIEEKSLDRGRSFSGLLGLSKYSELRQQLQALSNTVFFNRHFEVQAHKTTMATANQSAAKSRVAIAKDYETLVGVAPETGVSQDVLQQRCHAKLNSIPVLSGHCVDLPFMQIDIDACVATIQAEEGGVKRTRLSTVIQDHSKFSEANSLAPSTDDAETLLSLVKGRDNTLAKTAGDLLHKLYEASRNVLVQDEWPNTLCPTCEHDDGVSVLAKVEERLGDYQAVRLATDAVANEWVNKLGNPPALPGDSRGLTV